MLSLRCCLLGYDTATTQPLQPKYISTVDSGNFAGHLLAVRQFCFEHLPKGRIPPHAREGVIDTLVQLSREISMVKTVSVAAGGVTVAQLRDSVNTAIEMIKKNRATTLSDYNDFLLHLQSYLKDAEDLLNALSLEAASAAKFTECRVWMQCALTQVSELTRDVELLESNAESYMERKAMIADQCDALFKAMDFTFLFDAQRKLMVIGYNCNDNR